MKRKLVNNYQNLPEQVNKIFEALNNEILQKCATPHLVRGRLQQMKRIDLLLAD
jgi:hypothetical protein